MQKIVVEGGRRLHGTVAISGAKNAALPIHVSSLLTEGWNAYRNVPDLRDIRTIRALLTNLGVEVTTNKDVVEVNAGPKVAPRVDIPRAINGDALWFRKSY